MKLQSKETLFSNLKDVEETECVKTKLNCLTFWIRKST